jgi:hypothetical protein
MRPPHPTKHSCLYLVSACYFTIICLSSIFEANLLWRMSCFKNLLWFDCFVISILCSNICLAKQWIVLKSTNEAEQLNFAL